MKETRRKLDKIHNQIDKIAKKGKDFLIEYHKYVDEIVDKGSYGLFEQTLYYYYSIRIDNMDMEYVKNKTYTQILFQTNSSFLTKLKKLHDSKGIYQVGLDYFLSEDNSNLGQIQEKDIYSDGGGFYAENKDLARLIKTRKTFLLIIKDNQETIVDIDDESLSEENNLLNRYSIAIDILKN
jgi:hypothetical protein